MLRNAFAFLYVGVPAVGRGQTPAVPPVSKSEDAGFSAARLARIDTMVNGLIADSAIPGAVALIIRNGHTVLYKAYGVRNTVTRVPLRRDDIFRLASQSKAITALAVMMLWEEGRFQLDDPIARYIPEFANPTV